MGNNSFDRYAGKYDAWFLENRNVLYSEIKLVAHSLENVHNILSIGCGSGLFEMILEKDYDIFIKDGIEPSVDMAEVALKRGLSVEINTAEDVQIKPAKYDAILYNGSPGYINDLQKTVNKGYDALQDGGKVILIDIPKESLYGLLYNLAKVTGIWDHPLLKNVYLRNPYPIELVSQSKWRTTNEQIKMLENAGFIGIHAFQTFTTHPLYSNNIIEEPTMGYDKGDYVAVCGYKR